eukprot:CAMPEP_0184711568 /NCGR_PEP_ID=MMETSP0314-20130426/2213_1 /TAXON_ID=38298 /ORGANISM="Rhodella maculata, Strain CCMP 736" /LENGTH=96 /DNA_ID=CAMNT_0027173733 /DNA_START=587 /DNA_END=873 /DNA_ORIENTATION=+
MNDEPALDSSSPPVRDAPLLFEVDKWAINCRNAPLFERSQKSSCAALEEERSAQQAAHVISHGTNNAADHLEGLPRESDPVSMQPTLRSSTLPTLH